MTSSGDLPRSNVPAAWDTALAVCALAFLAVAAVWFCFAHGYILYYGDAQSHLDNSRALIDSRTPGYDQLGTPWLPLLHVICLPLVRNDWLWSTGLAGAIPVACCFVLAGVCFYLAAREAYHSKAAAAVAVACLACNPNVLYLAAIPMTEIVFLAGFAALLFSALRYRTTQDLRWLLLAVLSSWWACLTRFDGWFLLPFFALWFAFHTPRRKLFVLVAFGAASSLAPLYWLAHNWWETSNALDFYNGPYSAAAIQGAATYPGYHDWLAAVHYYLRAGELCSGWTLFLLGAAGIACAAIRRQARPILLLLLVPSFYVWSVHSSKLPIFIPPLWPHTYYNSRYGIAIVALCAFSAGAVVPLLPHNLKKFAFALPLVAALPWLAFPSQNNWICWKESQVNSIDRRAWTEVAARYLLTRYQTGQGILTSTGDVGGIYCRAGIHLSETLNIGNGPAWMAAIKRPDLYHPNTWAVYQRGDLLYNALGSSRRTPYRTVLEITTQNNPPLEISSRTTP